MGNFKVVVNRQQCFACGMAPRLCSAVFMRGGDNGKTRVTDKYNVQTSLDTSTGMIPKELYDCAKRAADACPYGAIHVKVS